MRSRRSVPLASGDEYGSQHRRSVGHYSVDAHVEKAAHFRFIIDGPDVNGYADRLRPPDETVVHKSNPAGRNGNLEAVTRGNRISESIAGGLDAGNRPRAHRRAKVRTQQRSQPFEAGIGEGTDADTVEASDPRQQVGERLDHLIGFRIDVHPDLRPCVENLLEARDRLGIVDQGSGDLAPRHFVDPTDHGGDPIESVVVECEDHPVGGDMCIRFHIRVSEVDCPGERRQCVLRPISGSASVGESDGVAMLQIRMEFPFDHVQKLEGSRRPCGPGTSADSLTVVGLPDGFIELIGEPDGSVPVEVLALEIAKHAHPELCVDQSLRDLDELAGACPDSSVESICRFLFVERGFAGNSTNYYDPRNSLLDVVIASRRGIPITLSIVLIAVGSRLGVGFHGVGLPGHFLVGLDDRNESFIDPFGGGQELDLAGVRNLYHRLHGADRAFGVGMLDPVGPRAMARRMLGNLDAIYASRRDLRSRLWASTLRASIPGSSIEEEADVASAHAALGSFDCAAERLELLALRSPDQMAENYRAVAAKWRSQLN